MMLEVELGVVVTTAELHEVFHLAFAPWPAVQIAQGRWEDQAAHDCARDGDQRKVKRV